MNPTENQVATTNVLAEKRKSQFEHVNHTSKYCIEIKAIFKHTIALLKNCSERGLLATEKEIDIITVGALAFVSAYEDAKYGKQKEYSTTTNPIYLCQGISLKNVLALACPENPQTIYPFYFEKTNDKIKVIIQKLGHELLIEKKYFFNGINTKFASDFSPLELNKHLQKYRNDIVLVPEKEEVVMKTSKFQPIMKLYGIDYREAQMLLKHKNSFSAILLFLMIADKKNKNNPKKFPQDIFLLILKYFTVYQHDNKVLLEFTQKMNVGFLQNRFFPPVKKDTPNDNQVISAQVPAVPNSYCNII